jgi:serine/threonine-protein kinase
MTDTLPRLTAALRRSYRIERELGQGGMATVYLAHDLKHERLVAIKVLHPELSAVLGAERFLSEIKTTAALQHPNILALFDSGAADGLLYYVMPYVEGETLRARLSREKQLPVEDVVAIARGSAAALDYAHRHGVIHRDIKPENILLQDGQPLVADFGIALAVKAAGGVRLTQTGLSLGTPQYMSPEQATAERELDARSDVYALGAVTYEMLTGEAPFTGSTTQAIIAKLMTEEPRPVSVLRRAVPAHLEEAVHRALEKLPADRWGSAAEFGAALVGGGKTGGSFGGRTAGSTRAAAPLGRRNVGRWLSAGVAVAAVTGALGWFIGRRAGGGDSPGAAPSRLALFPSGESISASGLARIIDISADGQTVAYAANGAVMDFIALRRLDAATSAPVPASDFARNLHFSPDGRYIYSPRGADHLQRTMLAGGGWTAMPWVKATPYLAWESDGTLWWTLEGTRGLHRSRPGSTKAERPFSADSSDANRMIQQILPGDRSALIVASAFSNSGQAAILDLASGASTPLLDFPIVEIRYTDGVLVYARPDNTLHAVAFDPAKGQVTGTPIQISDDISLTGGGVAQLAVSTNGTVIYLPSFGRELLQVDRGGSAKPLSGKKVNYHSPRFSPDGKRVALDDVGGDGRDVWVYDREQGQLTRATFDRDGHDPVWARDGKTIFYVSQRSGPIGIYRVRPGDGSPPDSILAISTLAYTGIPLADGKTLVTTATDLDGRSGNDIALVHAGSPNPLEPLFATPFQEAWAVPSPDDKWVAFTSDETGRQEIYIRRLSKEGTKTQVTLDGGSEPVWARDGRELFYRRPSGGQVELMVAEIQLGQQARVIKRTTLFDASDYEPAQPHANYDVAPDGRSFVMLRRSPSSHIVVIQNIRELVQRAARTSP